MELVEIMKKIEDCILQDNVGASYWGSNIKDINDIKQDMLVILAKKINSVEGDAKAFYFGIYKKIIADSEIKVLDLLLELEEYAVTSGNKKSDNSGNTDVKNVKTDNSARKEEDVLKIIKSFPTGEDKSSRVLYFVLTTKQLQEDFNEVKDKVGKYLSEIGYSYIIRTGQKVPGENVEQSKE